MLTERTMNAPRPYAPAFRRIRYAARYLRAFVLAIVADPAVVLRKSGRTIIWGKMRRTMIGWVPGLALHLKRRHGLTGGCTSCGASCNLLFRCPHWDAESRLCSIYEDRPIVCRLFPITPSDLRDRDLAAGATTCGYSFDREDSRPARLRQSEGD
jgi:Fe-S-cluster containining protein